MTRNCPDFLTRPWPAPRKLNLEKLGNEVGLEKRVANDEVKNRFLIFIMYTYLYNINNYLLPRFFLMLKSMTGFGRKLVLNEHGSFTVEIQTVNRKHFDASFSLPKEFQRFEMDFRKIVQGEISRGQVSLKMSAAFSGQGLISIIPNKPLILQLKKAWNELLEIEGLPKNDELYLNMLLGQKELFIYGELNDSESEYFSFLSHMISDALKELNEMRLKEGQVLLQDILERLKALSAAVKKISLLSPNSTEKYRKRLREKIEEALEKNIENEDRILREVALFAERVDISEEITRFNAHLNHFETIICSDKVTVGKTLEFILQELLREVNTIGSKSLDIAISEQVVFIKSELEKIREQIQNVE